MKLAYNNMIDGSTISITSSSQTANYPDDYVADSRLIKKWRTTGLTTEWIKFDAGSGNTFAPTIGIIAAHNFSASVSLLKIQGSANDFSTTPVDIAVTYNAGTMIATLPGTAYRYWRLYFTDASNTDGYVQIGRIFLGLSYTLTNTFAQNFIESRVDNSNGVYSYTGQYYSDEGITLKKYDFDFNGLTKTSKGYLASAFEYSKKAKPFFTVLNGTDMTDLPPLYCVFDSDIELNNIHNLNYWSNRMTLKEVK